MAELVVAVDVGTGSARAGVLRRRRPPARPRRAPDRAARTGAAPRRARQRGHLGRRRRRGARRPRRGRRRQRTRSPASASTPPARSSCATARASRWPRLGRRRRRAGTPSSGSTTAPSPKPRTAPPPATRCSTYIGGVMSPEMQIPKLMWLKRHRPDSWARAGLVFDLADFLTWRATGNTARSICTLTCKWTYLGHAPPGWRPDFLEAVGLDDLLLRAGLPDAATPVGADLGPLTAAAAEHLGLTPRDPRRRRTDRRPRRRARRARRAAAPDGERPRRGADRRHVELRDAARAGAAARRPGSGGRSATRRCPACG